MNDVLVIGGGGAGMLAAIAAGRAGARVTLLERNEKLGKKVYITGKGRCNVTNACDPDAFQKSVVKNPRFLFSALNALPPQALMDLLEELGCPVMVERGERVFPRSEKANDVNRAFERELGRLRVNVQYHSRVKDLLVENDRCLGAELMDGRVFRADSVIVCTGGQSYVSTGSTGDGWKWFENLGHTLYPPKPSLVGLMSGANWVKDLQGLALKNVRVNLTRGKKKLYSDIGEMLFTHFGVSGPLVLSSSSYMAELSPSDVTLAIDLKPGLTAEQLDRRLQRDIDESGKKMLRTLLCGLYPSRLAEIMPTLCGIDPNKTANELTREERMRLVETTKALVIPITGHCSLNEAIITRGGVSVKDINPATMESKRISGLYAAGEFLDVDALTGGFNLHIAFCTGYLAGCSAAKGN